MAFCNYRGPFLYPIGVNVGLVCFLVFPAHGDPLRLNAIAVFLPNPLIGIITGKYEIVARKRKKNRCSNYGDFRLRGRRFWRHENDGDSVLGRYELDISNILDLMINTQDTGSHSIYCCNFVWINRTCVHSMQIIMVMCSPNSILVNAKQTCHQLASRRCKQCKPMTTYRRITLTH